MGKSTDNKQWIEHFDVNFELFHRISQIGHTFVVEQTLPFLDIKPGDRILDIGSGTGLVTCAIKRQTGFVVGLDASLHILQLAQKNNKAVNWICADVFRLPFKPNSFEKVFCNSLIQYFSEKKDLPRFIEEIKKVCTFNYLILIGDVVDAESSTRKEIMDLIKHSIRNGELLGLIRRLFYLFLNRWRVWNLKLTKYAFQEVSQLLSLSGMQVEKLPPSATLKKERYGIVIRPSDSS